MRIMSYFIVLFFQPDMNLNNYRDLSLATWPVIIISVLEFNGSITLSYKTFIKIDCIMKSYMMNFLLLIS